MAVKLTWITLVEINLKETRKAIELKLGLTQVAPRTKAENELTLSIRKFNMAKCKSKEPLQLFWMKYLTKTSTPRYQSLTQY
jgi:hypothetical protein